MAARVIRNSGRWLQPDEWISLLLLGLFFLAAALPAALLVISGDLPEVLLREDGVYESGAALICLVASILCFVAYSWSGNRLPERNGWLLLLGLACFFIAGEEISWGQRILGLELPPQLLESNFQAELNLHNSKMIQSGNNIMSEVLAGLLTLYLLLLPVVVTVLPSVGKVLETWRLPVPSMRIALLVITIKIASLLNYQIVYGADFERDYLRVGEAFESLLEACLLLTAFEFLCAYRARKS